MKKTSHDQELQRQAEMLARLPDETIDTSDIPELTAEAWSRARRPGLQVRGRLPANDSRPLRKPSEKKAV